MNTIKAAPAVAALVLWLCGGVPFAQADDEKHARDKPLTFTVKAAVPADDRSRGVVLTLTLSLDPAARTDVAVTTYEPGTIGVASATRNGKPIKPLEGVTRFVDDLLLLQASFLTTITPGDSVTIPFDVPRVPGQGPLLVVTRPNPKGEPVALTYPLTEPGVYTLRFLYRYTGPDDGRPNVFRDTVRSNKVTFRLP